MARPSVGRAHLPSLPLLSFRPLQVVSPVRCAYFAMAAVVVNV